MTPDVPWRTIRERCESLDPDAVLVTPSTDRVFAVQRTDDDGIDAAFRDGGERRLHRDQFGVLVDRIDAEGLAIDAVPPGVEPYVSVLTLHPAFVVDETGTLVRVEDPDEAAEPPFVRSRWDVRRPPEAVRDDALLLADFLDRRDVADLSSLAPGDLVDLYVLLSDVQWGADDLRRDAGEELLEHVGPDGRLHGRYGTVTRTRRERRRVKDEDEVLARLDEAGVPREWVLGVDPDKLDVVVAATDVETADVFDVDEQYYVQKTGVESAAKRSTLQGLADRLAALESDEGDRLHEEVDALEDRIDDALAAE